MYEGLSQKVDPDTALLRRAQAEPGSPGGRRAASELLARYQERVYIWCRRQLGDHERALDAAQEVLLSAYRNLASFRGSAQFSSWLFAIARNRCISEMRRPRFLVDEAADPDALGDRREDPAEALLEKLDEERVLGLIRQHLEPREQAVIWMRCIEGMSIPAITRALAIEQSSGARGVLQRARRRLRAAMATDQAVGLGSP